METNNDLNTAKNAATNAVTMEPESMDDQTTGEVPPPPSFPPPQGSPPPPPPPRPGQRASWWHVPVARDPQERRIGGVLAGVAKAYGFERRTTRIAVAVSALVVPVVLTLYIAAWILLPRTQAEAKPLSSIMTDRRKLPIVIVLGIISLATGFGSWTLFGGLGWGVGLVAVGVVLWLSPNFGSGFARADAPTGANFSPADAPVALSNRRRQVPRLRRHPVQAAGLAVAAVGALVMSIGNGAGWWNVSTYVVTLTVLATLVASSVAGTIVNRSWLGVPGMLVLGACTIGLIVTHPNLDGGIGDRTVRPTTVAEAEQHDQVGIGRLTIDLRQVPAGEQSRTPVPVMTVDAVVGYGQIHVIVPADAEIQLVTDVNAGHVVVNDNETAAGIRRRDSVTIPARATSTGTHRTIVIDARLGGGEIRIDQSS